MTKKPSTNTIFPRILGVVDNGHNDIVKEEKCLKFIQNTSHLGDRSKAIKELVEGIQNGKKHQVLLGATGTGKTFTIANVIEQVQKPTLILSHNKTLAGQLYSEFRELFPENRVEYFVS